MQLLKIDKNLKLSELTEKVGSRNVDNVLALNSLTRKPNIGEQFSENCQDIVDNNNVPDNQRKLSILNSLVDDSDIFEETALQDDDGWIIMSELGTLPGMLRIPETVTLPDSTDILGNGEAVGDTIYAKTLEYINKSTLNDTTLDIDPGIFNEYSGSKYGQISDSSKETVIDVIQWFNLPWGKVTLYSSLADESVDFPVFPEELEDGVQANYEEMADILYQYEPWQVYKSSGPRTNELTFNMHRDMWSGNHLDGKCNELIRFCEANCYPEFQGASVQTATVTLYIAGSAYISGILTSVSVTWDGPLGQDDWYLHCTLKLSITEVSEDTLNFSKVKSKGLIS